MLQVHIILGLYERGKDVSEGGTQEISSLRGNSNKSPISYINLEDSTLVHMDHNPPI